MTALIAGAWIAGTLGSVHCLAMCSGISGSLAMGIAPSSVRGRRAAFIALYNAGRIASYAIAGAVLGWSSQIIGTTLDVPFWAEWLRLFAALMLVMLGLQILTRWRPLQWIERGGATVWRRLSPLAKKLVPVDSSYKALGLGLLWGWLPCGLVYSVLPMAAATANPGHGALLMIAFGLGTAPSMVASGHFADLLKRSATRRGIIAGGILVVLGLAAAWIPIQHIVSSGADHQHSRIAVNQLPLSLPRSADSPPPTGRSFDGGAATGGGCEAA